MHSIARTQYTCMRDGKAFILRAHEGDTAEVVMQDVDPQTGRRGPETQLTQYAGARASVLALVAWMYVTRLVRR